MPLSLHEQRSSINYDGMFPLINKARVTHKIQICHSQHSDSMRTVLILGTNYIMLFMLFGKLKDKEIKMLCLSPAKKLIDMESPILIPWCPSEIYLSILTHTKQQEVFVKTCSKSNYVCISYFPVGNSGLIVTLWLMTACHECTCSHPSVWAVTVIAGASQVDIRALTDFVARLSFARHALQRHHRDASALHPHLWQGEETEQQTFKG